MHDQNLSFVFGIVLVLDYTTFSNNNTSITYVLDFFFFYIVAKVALGGCLFVDPKNTRSTYVIKIQKKSSYDACPASI